MPKRIIALFLILLCLCTSAAAEYHIANPNPADRLHLRHSPSANAKSLGKYYNGTPIEALSGDVNGWVKVRIGMGSASQTGYMNASYLSDSRQRDAMPQYITASKMYAHTQPGFHSAMVNVPAGRLVSLMGIIEGERNWYHLMIHTQTSEGSYFCFAAEGDGFESLKALVRDNGVKAYISNPDKRDRLHLRAQPDMNAKSLGKFYNGAKATVLGFEGDGTWVKVDLYGQTGYMHNDFLYLDGEGPNPTCYGIPTVHTVGNSAKIYCNPPDASDNYMDILKPGTEVEVLGVINDQLLQIRHLGPESTVYYIYREDTDFVDTRYESSSDHQTARLPQQETRRFDYALYHLSTSARLASFT